VTLSPREVNPRSALENNDLMKKGRGLLDGVWLGIRDGVYLSVIGVESDLVVVPYAYAFLIYSHTMLLLIDWCPSPFPNVFP